VQGPHDVQIPLVLPHGAEAGGRRGCQRVITAAGRAQQVKRLAEGARRGLQRVGGPVRVAQLDEDTRGLRRLAGGTQDEEGLVVVPYRSTGVAGAVQTVPESDTTPRHPHVLAAEGLLQHRHGELVPRDRGAEVALQVKQLPEVALQLADQDVVGAGALHEAQRGLQCVPAARKDARSWK
jgi:hypothetical protein